MIGSAYPIRFWWLCVGAYFFFGSFNMIIPELPALLEGFGAGEHKGLIISLFTLTALLARPFSGKLADTVGRVPVMAIGAAVCVVCSLLYPWLTTFAGFMWLRLLHGFSTGFSPTGFSAYVADFVPADRRGEAIGLVSTFGSLGMASSPMFGSWLAAAFSMNTMFIASAVFGLLALVIFARLPESLDVKQSFRLRHLTIRFQDLFEPSVRVPFLVMAMTAYSYGAMLTLIPDRSTAVGIDNKGSMFMVFALASVAVRIFAGRLSDLYGRVPVLITGVMFLISGMSLCAFGDAYSVFIMGCIGYGVANGIISPTLFAWATDLSPVDRKARAFASLYIALELGIGLGALLSGYMLSNYFSGYSIAFLAGAGLGCLSLVSLIYRLTRIN